MSPELVTAGNELAYDKSKIVQIYINPNGFGFSIEHRSDGWQFNFKERNAINKFLGALSSQMQLTFTEEEKETNLLTAEEAIRKNFNRPKKGYSDWLRQGGISIKFSQDELVGVEQTNIGEEPYFGYINTINLRFKDTITILETYRLLVKEAKMESSDEMKLLLAPLGIKVFKNTSLSP